MTQDPYTWEDQNVIERTVSIIMSHIEPWRLEHGRGHRTEKDASDLTAAMRFAGESADAFQMARFLEDSRFWPVNQALLMPLLNAQQARLDAINALEDERKPKPVLPLPWAIGLFFRTSGEIYKVVGMLQPCADTDNEQGYTVADRSGLSFRVSHSAIKRFLERWGTVSPSDRW